MGGVQSMRVTRAYIAGFGTAGSLLAAASVLFVLATAVVAYRGWPQVADAGPAPALVLAGTPEYGVTASNAAASRGAVAAPKPTSHVVSTAATPARPGHTVAATQPRTTAGRSSPPATG